MYRGQICLVWTWTFEKLYWPIALDFGEPKPISDISIERSTMARLVIIVNSSGNECFGRADVHVGIILYSGVSIGKTPHQIQRVHDGVLAKFNYFGVINNAKLGFSGNHYCAHSCFGRRRQKEGCSGSSCQVLTPDDDCQSVKCKNTTTCFVCITLKVRFVRRVNKMLETCCGQCVNINPGSEINFYSDFRPF